MEDRSGYCVEQDDEGDERDDGVGRNTEGKSVDFAIEQVGDEGLAVLAPAEPLGTRDRDKIALVGGNECFPLRTGI